MVACTLSMLAALALVPSHGAACATAIEHLPGLPELPEIDDESALIVWDPETHVEDFVRTADFDTDVERFAFLVPTPSVPTLHEVDEAPLDAAARLLTPRIRRVEEHRWVLGFAFLEQFGARVKSKVRGASVLVDALPVPSVEELSHTRVAGMDATVVRSEDPLAMQAWLEAHGFAMRPALRDWIATYVARGYVFTAFRYERAEGESSVSTRAVRMRFSTDRAYFPYAEPTDAPRGDARPFRLTLLSSRPLHGEVGARRIEADGLLRRRIDAATLATDGLTHEVTPERDYVFEGRAAPTWATVLRETATVRGPDDLFFAPDPVETENVPEEVVTVVRERVFPMDCTFFFLVALGVAIELGRRGRAGRADRDRRANA